MTLSYPTSFFSHLSRPLGALSLSLCSITGKMRGQRRCPQERGAGGGGTERSRHRCIPFYFFPHLQHSKYPSKLALGHWQQGPRIKTRESPRQSPKADRSVRAQVLHQSFVYNKNFCSCMLNDFIPRFSAPPSAPAWISASSSVGSGGKRARDHNS